MTCVDRFIQNVEKVDPFFTMFDVDKRVREGKGGWTRADTQKFLEKIRKQSRQHAMIVNDHRSKKQKTLQGQHGGGEPGQPMESTSQMPQLQPGQIPQQQPQMQMQQQPRMMVPIQQQQQGGMQPQQLGEIRKLNQTLSLPIFAGT